ncbi:MAG: potassium/proton antiporter [Nevskiales bacterium]
MELTNQLILLAGVLFIISILATVVSPRVGAPLLLVFLIIGMLAGENGPGGIQFNNYPLANLAATAALAVVLFDGGMRTRIEDFRVGLRPALALATLGVVLTFLIVGAFARWLLDLSWAEGLLLGAIVASTDAAATFSLLQTSGVTLNQRVSATLEIESGTNDPVAIFLTLGVIGFMQAGTAWSLLDPLWLLTLQFGLGAAFGIYGGRLLVYALNRLELAESLYPLFALFGGLLIFGITAVFEGSGFLAVYLAGLTLGNRRVHGAAAIRRFHDGITWMSQIGMFLILGLLATPSDLLPVAAPALLVALVLILVARPLAVWLCLWPFRFPPREKFYVSWIGLRGTVPIVLATFPWVFGLENAALYFNITFFIVLVSLVLQGWTAVPLARWLDLDVPDTSVRVRRVDFDLPGSHAHEIVSYRVAPDSGVRGLRLKELSLPETARVVSVVRRGLVQPYREWGVLQEGDHVSLLAEQDELSALDVLFERKPQREARTEADRQRFFGDFPIEPGAPLQALADIYNLELPPDARGATVADYIMRVLPRPVVGDRLKLGEVSLVVKEMEEGRIVEVGLHLGSD